ncbi:hypothetical protein KNJ79_05355 [Sphingopyxis indica]|uniref:hypothetical protein n=1 Tax=Sphingopyxis indica TaxID=436663 RepID=UPI0029394FE3|nr:hypothetical protein [Sphingopyxis indica]WOF44360.1 hypothetical protein KNJ79_05355 [Sphingopyxis indica]
MRHITDLIEELNADLGTGILYHAWETRGEEDQLPKTTLMGLDGFNFHENAGLWIVRFSVTVSSYQDINLLKEFDILDGIYEWFGEKKRVPLRDMSSGEEENQLVVTDFEVAPMAQTMIRNYRTVSIELKRTANDG